MPELLWDASALLKRYALETGSDTVDMLFNSLPPTQMLSTLWSYTETYAVLVRKRNSGRISDEAFAQAAASLQAEVLAAGDFRLLTVEDTALLNSMTFIEQHSINSADAAILATFLQYTQSLPSSNPTCLLVASDRRLLRAANGEGLQTLNPELLSVSDVSSFLAGLS